VVQLSPVLAEFAISVRSGNKPVALLRPFVPCPLPRHGFDEVHNPRRSSVSGGSGSRAGSRVPRSSLCDVQRLTKPSGLGVVLCTLVGCRLIWARDPSRRPLGRASVEGPLPPVSLSTVSCSVLLLWSTLGTIFSVCRKLQQRTRAPPLLSAEGRLPCGCVSCQNQVSQKISQTINLRKNKELSAITWLDER
jgi:hypothetical protein